MEPEFDSVLWLYWSVQEHGYTHALASKIPHFCTQIPSYIWKPAGSEIEFPAQEKWMPGLVCLQSSRLEALTLLSLWWDVNISFSARSQSQSSTRRKWTQSIQLFTSQLERNVQCAIKLPGNRTFCQKSSKNIWKIQVSTIFLFWCSCYSQSWVNLRLVVH